MTRANYEGRINAFVRNGDPSGGSVAVVKRRIAEMVAEKERERERE